MTREGFSNIQTSEDLKDLTATDEVENPNFTKIQEDDSSEFSSEVSDAEGQAGDRPDDEESDEV